MDTKRPEPAAGVIGVFTAADVIRATYGRAVRDVPILARDAVRFTGEPIAAVVAETREAAEAAAALVDVTTTSCPRCSRRRQAMRPGAPPVHDEPWSYPGAAISADDGHNLQSSRRARLARGGRDAHWRHRRT